MKITLREAYDAWKGTLSVCLRRLRYPDRRRRSGHRRKTGGWPTAYIFAPKDTDGSVTQKGGCYQTSKVYVCRHKVARPRVFIPVFPGTNCEYDSKKAFERAGAEVDVRVFAI